MLAIAFIIISIKYSLSLTDSKKLAIENGVEEEDFDILRIGLWFYIIPQAIGFFLPGIYKIYLLPLILAAYIPSIYYGLKISKKLDRGHDYVRKLGRQVNQIVWIGYGGIVLVILTWLLIYTNTLMRGI
ncbi:MAG TPA: hypothetical protein VMV32_06880 [Ignavibacteriaceae bacterium]|nr:hypothetical protein [Ignavibacteriaceae bacterium]